MTKLPELVVVADGYNQMPITGFKDLIGDNIGVLVTLLTGLSPETR